jgi:hypothetical protein
MIFTDIVGELKRLDELEENADLNNLGQKMLVMTCLIVCPETTGSIESSADLNEEHMNLANEIVITPKFAELFRNMCQMESIPDINLSQIKHVKS